MTKVYTEEAFEDAIEHSLLENGYLRGDPMEYDKATALFPGEVLGFIRRTQPDDWAYLEQYLGAKAEEQLLGDLVKALNSDRMGSLHVLRHGFKSYGRLFRLAFFAPASGLNPETVERYEANRLLVVRQLVYSDKHDGRLDLALVLNGLPLVTMELKNPLTCQTFKDAVRQYKNERDYNDLLFKFKQRALVHFAVDPDEVWMTTQLKGGSTHFLPFNKGCGMGAGNPPREDNYDTAYLWEEVLERESFLDILARFVSIEQDKYDRERMIFPRYHQLDCVRRLVDDAAQQGSGTNYLIQHSTGSGKSKTIAWLAHRLSSLHDENDEKLFHSVVVVTDRVVLDQQLQNTIYQIDHKQGVVEKIDKDSAQLADALQRGVPIIVTTLQKFPFVTEKIEQLPKRDYAVIIDEAHSSQGGVTATELKGVLAGAHIKEEAQRIKEEENRPDSEDEIIKTMLQRGRQPNISFFAFTATPKYKTLEIFGVEGPDGKPRPFHLYSMRQAIEEGFIMDVLQHYTTYKTYHKLIKDIEDDPKVEKGPAARALVRYLKIHPHNLSQKTRVMIEHFRNSVERKINSRAKAMVVTGSRLEAVRYKQAFDKYISEQGYDIKTLVAFSGEVEDPKAQGMTYTEVRMNEGIREKELPERFGTDDYQILIVAEKYQTGFDQPLLHTMYVDKRLDGIQAVQTLSRLNRIHQLKEDTFVMDFYNDPEGIQRAFEPYYECTLISEQVEPHQLYELQEKLTASNVFYRNEVEEFTRVFFKGKRNRLDHQHLNAILEPAVNRFSKLPEEEQQDFRKSLVAYRNLYAFMSQILPFHDTDLEKLFTFVRFLSRRLPHIQGAFYQFDDDVKLEYYRLQKISEGSISLDDSKDSAISGPDEVGTGKAKKDEVELSQLIDVLNERFGTEFKPADQCFFDAIAEDAVADSSLTQAAQVNKLDNFEFVFSAKLEDLIVNRIEQNNGIAEQYLNDSAFREVIMKRLAREVYTRLAS